MQTDLYESLREKSLLKQDVYRKTQQSFETFRNIIRNLVDSYDNEYIGKEKVDFEMSDGDDFRIQLHFGGDVLIFMLHTNIFQFPRLHEVMKTRYISEDSQRSYCGVINIYNFLADSFRFNRYNDLGYLIGRVFINKDIHYFIEGKREIGQLYNNFETSVLDNSSITDIIKSAIQYTVNFDLLTPPYDEVKLVRVGDMQAESDIKLVTGKRLGFRFQADHVEIKEQKVAELKQKI